MPVRHILLAVAVAALWGVNFVVIDIGLRDFPPLLFVALRYALMAFPAVLFVARPQVPFRYVLGFGVILSAGTQGLLFVSMHLGMPAGLASLFVQLQVVFTIVFSVALLGERPGRRQLIGALVALAGIAVIGLGRGGGHIPVGALLLCVGSALAWGAGNVIVRKAKAPDAFALLVWSSLIAPVPLLALSVAFEGVDEMGAGLASAGPGAVAALLYVVVVATAFGIGTWTWLLRRHTASKVAPFGLLVPISGIASAWLVLGERPAALELAGAAVVLAGLALVTIELRSKAPAQPVR